MSRGDGAYRCRRHEPLRRRSKLDVSRFDTDGMAGPLESVVVPVDVSEQVSIEGVLSEVVSPSEVVVLGYWSIPEQAAPGQVRDRFGETASERLERVASGFEAAGVDVRSRLAFTGDRERLIDAAVNEYGSQAVLMPGGSRADASPNRGLVLVKPDADLDRLVGTLASAFADGDAELLLFHVTGDRDVHLRDATRYMLRGLEARLVEAGIDPGRIDREQSTERDRLEAILARAADAGFVVLSETEPSVRERVFGTVQSRLATETDAPLLTVRSGVEER